MRAVSLDSSVTYFPVHLLLTCFLLFTSTSMILPLFMFLSLVLFLFNIHISGFTPVIYSYLSGCSCSLFIVHIFLLPLFVCLSLVLLLFCSYLWCCPCSIFISPVLPCSNFISFLFAPALSSLFISLLLHLFVCLSLALPLFCSYLWCCPCSIFIYLVMPLFNMHISGVAPFQYSYI